LRKQKEEEEYKRTLEERKHLFVPELAKRKSGNAGGIFYEEED